MSAPRPKFLRKPYLPSDAEVAAATTPKAKARLMRITVQDVWHYSDLQKAVAYNGRNDEHRDFNQSCNSLRMALYCSRRSGRQSETLTDHIACARDYLNDSVRQRHLHERSNDRLELMAAE